MDITGISASATGKPETPDKTNDQLGKDEFLKLLITQLQNQDPMNPLEGTEFATQLAQFNSVEQLLNLNEQVASLSEAQMMMSSGLNNSLAANLTGKNVKVVSDFIEPESGGMHFRLQDSASSVELNILDANGTLIRSDTLGSLGKGDHHWIWDGKSGDGKSVPEGSYIVKLSAKNGDSEVAGLTFTEGEVEKVRFTGQGVKVMVNGQLLPLGDVEEIRNKQ